MPQQRPYFLSSFIAAFRQQGPSLSSTSAQHQANKHTTQGPASTSATVAAAAAAAQSSSSAPRTIASNSASSHHHHHHHSNVAIHSPRANGSTTPGASGTVPIPTPGRRRGSDSSSEGFREVIGADKWYIGGLTAGGEEKFFKMGVVRRVRSNDGLSLDRLSL